MATDQSPLYLTRDGARRYVAHNGSTTIIVGDKNLYDDVFNPGELLQLALAGCAAMSADTTLSHRLGDDAVITAGVGSELDEDTNRFTAIAVEIVASMDTLDEDDRAALIERTSRAIQKYCTVARTVTAEFDYSVSVTGELS
ncbi:MAG: OsmC family protein [Actinomycetaceae bacterium]|nr:OsmC family protein [Actinomycetaceae bacterium]MDU0971113.1 OsmC family protein [Actinomycetaceae bacterium]